MLVEVTLSMPIRNPRTGARSRTFEFAGKVDQLEGQAVTDYKSTSDAARFVRQRELSLQAELYALLAKEAGHTITEVGYRIVETHKLQYTEPTFTYAVMRAGRKSAVRVFDNRDDADELALAQGCEVVERVKGYRDRQAYENRCFCWHLEDPARLVDHSLPLSNARLTTAREYLWNCTQRILECRRYDRWLPNPHACFAWERECPYMDLCRCDAGGGDVQWVIDDNYRVVDDTHPELNGLNRPKRSNYLLTYSSLSILTLCERKYYWHDELALRKGEEESEALWLGNAMHVGLEAYANDGEKAAFAAVDKWDDEHPTLGEDNGRHRDKMVARARAMVRAAAVKWPEAIG